MELNTKRKLLSTLILSLTLVGCGGGGDSSAPSSTNANTSSTNSSPTTGNQSNTTVNNGTTEDSQNSQNEIPSTITGRAIDGYLQKAIVCLDLDKDSFCDVRTEPTDTTEDDGSFEIVITEEHQKHPNFHEAMLIVFDGKDSDTGKRYEGKLQATPVGSKIFITPASTLAAKKIAASIESKKQQDSQFSGADIRKFVMEEAPKAGRQVAKLMGLPEDFDINQDPIEEVKKTQGEESRKFLAANIALHRTVEVLVTSAKQDSTYQNLDADEIQDKMMEALAEVDFDEVLQENAENSIETFMQKAMEKKEFKEKVGTKVVKAKEAAVQMAKQSVDAFKEIEFTGKTEEEIEREFKLKSIQTIGQVNRFAEKMEEDKSYLDNFDVETYKNEVAQEKIEFNPLVDIIRSIGVKLSKSDVAEINAQYPASDVFNISELQGKELTAENVAQLSNLPSEIKNKMLAKLAEIESLEEEAKLKYATEQQIAFPSSFNLFNFDVFNHFDENENKDKMVIHMQNVILSESDTVTMERYKYVKNAQGDREFVLEEDNYNVLVLDTDTGLWQQEEVQKNINAEFNANRTVISLPSLGEQARIKNRIDISGKDKFIPELRESITMPTGAEMVTIEIERVEDQYRLFREFKGHQDKTYSSLNAFINDHLFVNETNFKDFMGGFSLLPDDPSNPTSGTVIRVESFSNNAVLVRKVAKWQLASKHGVEMLEIQPKQQFEHLFNQGKLRSNIIFAEHDGMVKHGERLLENTFHKEVMYNHAALDLIKSKLENLHKEFTDYRDQNTSEKGKVGHFYDNLGKDFNGKHDSSFPEKNKEAEKDKGPSKEDIQKALSLFKDSAGNPMFRVEAQTDGDFKVFTQDKKEVNASDIPKLVPNYKKILIDNGMEKMVMEIEKAIENEKQKAASNNHMNGQHDGKDSSTSSQGSEGNQSGSTQPHDNKGPNNEELKKALAHFKDSAGKPMFKVEIEKDGDMKVFSQDGKELGAMDLPRLVPNYKQILIDNGMGETAKEIEKAIENEKQKAASNNQMNGQQKGQDSKSAQGSEGNQSGSTQSHENKGPNNEELKKALAHFKDTAGNPMFKIEEKGGDMKVFSQDGKEVGPMDLPKLVPNYKQILIDNGMGQAANEIEKEIEKKRNEQSTQNSAS